LTTPAALPYKPRDFVRGDPGSRGPRYRPLASFERAHHRHLLRGLQFLSALRRRRV